MYVLADCFKVLTFGLGISVIHTACSIIFFSVPFNA